MDRAAKAVRRSSARLMGASHADLNVLISEISSAKAAAKAFNSSQAAVSTYMLKWASGENPAIQDVITHIDTLNQLWTEVQKDFSAKLKEIRHMFSMILEGEKSVALMKSNLSACELKETKHRKELHKAQKHTSNSALPNLVGQLEYRVGQSEQASNQAHVATLAATKEHEAVKMIRLKEGLLRMTEAYVELGQKCDLIFATQGDIVQEMPDVCDKTVEQLTYSGYKINRERVQKTKLMVHQYKQGRRRRSSQHFVSPEPTEAAESEVAYPHPPASDDMNLSRERAVNVWLADIPPAPNKGATIPHSGRRSCPPLDHEMPQRSTLSRDNLRRQSMPTYERSRTQQPRSYEREYPHIDELNPNIDEQDMNIHELNPNIHDLHTHIDEMSVEPQTLEKTSYNT